MCITCIYSVCISSEDVGSSCLGRCWGRFEWELNVVWLWILMFFSGFFLV